MPDASKAKARRRAAAVRDAETMAKIVEYGDNRAIEAVNNAITSIPDGYRKVAESEDMYTRTRIGAYYHSSFQNYYFRIKDDDVDRTVGPLKKRNLQTLLDVVKDVLTSGPHHFIE